MVSVACFEVSGTKSYVSAVCTCVLSGHCGLVDYVRSKAVSVQWAVSSYPTVAVPSGGCVLSVLVQYMSVV